MIIPTSRRMKPLKVVHLFAGMGGSHLAGALLGWRSVASVEIDKSCQRILRAHFPGELVHDDVRTFDARGLGADMVVSGFPCTNLSPAGARSGLEGGPQSNLFYQGVRVASEARVPLLFVENVLGFLTAPAHPPPGGKRRIGSGPMTAEEREIRREYVEKHRGESFENALRALQQNGYGLIRWTVNRASDANVGAPHRRERVWMLAQYTGSTRAGRWKRPADWPAKGILDGDDITVLEQWVPRVKDATLWVTPDATQQKKATPASHQEGLWSGAFKDAGLVWQSGVKGQAHLDPEWVETIMGWPIGWTAGDPAAMQNWPARDGLWPAGRGSFQHKWEPPRLTLDLARENLARLKALGNGWVPHQAVAAFKELTSP